MSLLIQKTSLPRYKIGQVVNFHDDLGRIRFGTIIKGTQTLYGIVFTITLNNITFKRNELDVLPL